MTRRGRASPFNAQAEMADCGAAALAMALRAREVATELDDLRELPKLRDPDKLRPWLYAIVRRAALRELHVQRREPAFEEVPDTVATGPGPVTVTAQNELAQLISHVSALSDRDRRVLELAYRQGLSGPDLANAVGVSHESAKKLLQRLRDTVERSLGAPLVARHGAQHGCPQLAQTLAPSDGAFTILMRKRIARHVESCAACGAYRSSVVNSVAVLSGVVLDRRS